MATKKATKKTKKVADDQVEARPIGQGKDPLAEGARLYNPSNTEAETHYKADDSELKAEEEASKIRGMDANERAEVHNAETPTAPDNTPNSSLDEQDEVAAGRVEEAVNPPVDDTPEEVEVPERTEEQEAADAEERADAVETAAQTTDK